MTATRFDAIARLFARNRQSPPTAVPATWEKIPYLFVQSFQGGSLTANPDAGTHTLTLEQGLGQTVYFSDRPGRDVGVTLTPQFLETLGFPADNPPNAALVVDAGDGETDLAVVELFDPAYDEATNMATYQVRGLEAWEDNPDQGFHAIPADLSSLAGDFGAAHLLIDDCPEDEVRCSHNRQGVPEIVGHIKHLPFCYNFLLCIPCEPYGHDNPDRCSVVHYWNQRCTETFAECEGDCTAEFSNKIWLCSE